MVQDALSQAGYPDHVVVACSGGPDSLALASVAAYFARRGHVDGHPVTVGAVVVDHQLQDGSGQVAAQTAQVMRNLGAVLAGAGMSFGDVVKATVYLSDLAVFAALTG